VQQQGSGKRIPQVTQQGGGAQVIKFPIPTSGVGPFRIIANGTNVWFTEQNQAAIGEVSAAGVVTQFPIGSGGVGTGSASGLVTGPDKNIWFTGPAYVAHSVTGGSPVQFTLPPPASINGSVTPCPGGIAAGSDGALWFTDSCNGAVGRITTDGSTITEYPLPTANAAPFDIVAGPDNNLWVVEQGIAKIARIVPATAAITEFALPQTGLQTQYITNANGSLWFTFGAYSGIGRMTTKGSAAFVPGAQSYVGITKGPDNNEWMTDESAGNFTSVSSAGSFASPVALGIPSAGLVTGSDKNIWFTDAANNSIDVYVLYPQTVTQSSIAFNMAGETQTFSASEPGYTGTELTASSSNVKVATVTPTSLVGQWRVTAVAGGTCTISVRDQYGNTTPISVSVTTETFVVK
jgi:virginiamycin B lyase